MTEGKQTVAFLHYSAPPVVGGVESVMLAHLRLFVEAGYSTAVIAGRGERTALPPETDLIQIPEMDSNHPAIMSMSQDLEQGRVPQDFEEMAAQLEKSLLAVVRSVDSLIVHNVFTKHFNLPLTTALFRLLDQGKIAHCIAWCHDITWTSPNSRSKVFSGYPWDLLRTHRRDVSYVTVSKERQRDLSSLLGCPSDEIQVVYNGVDPVELLALSSEGSALIECLSMWQSDLNLLMPVRVTKAKNIELALQVTADLKSRGVRPKLVVTGPPDPHDRSSMEYFESLLEMRERLSVVEEARFVYESGPVPGEPYRVDMSVVAEILRVSDALFMPSLREGFGMPVLEAGLAGIPVFCADAVPSANEIGQDDVILFSPQADAAQVADLLIRCTRENKTLQLRRRVRQALTWRSIFERQILPLAIEDAI